MGTLPPAFQVETPLVTFICFSGRLNLLSKDNRWITSLLMVFQSYQDDGRTIMHNEALLRLVRFSPPAGLEPGTARSAVIYCKRRKLLLNMQILSFMNQSPVEKGGKNKSSRVAYPAPEVIKLFSCSSQLSMKF